MTDRPTLTVGARVRRKIEIGGTDYRYGTIIDIYHSRVSSNGLSHSLYRVKWDNTATPDEGYLGYDLEAVHNAHDNR